MKFTKIPETTFANLQLNAGVLLSTFNVSTPTVADANIIGATTGGVTFNATPTFNDFGEDIDNCPKNMLELKKLDQWEVTMSGSFVTASATMVKRLISAGTLSGNKITPRQDVLISDFEDVWWVGDYSDKNGETNGGFLAIHMLNTLATGGFSLKSGDKAKGTFDFEFTGHYSMDAQTVVPFEVYVVAGTDEPTTQSLEEEDEENG